MTEQQIESIVMKMMDSLFDGIPVTMQVKNMIAQYPEELREQIEDAFYEDFNEFHTSI